MTLPNFLVAGVPKGGTTSLNFYLGQHPEIFVVDEATRYFIYDPKSETFKKEGKDHFPVRSMAEYTALFDDVTDEKAIGEATPFYMFSPVALERIPRELPEVKLLISLREPIARAYSAYWMQSRLGRENRPMEEALAEGTSYVQHGFYSHYLTKWYERCEASRIKVILLDDLKDEPLNVFQDICRFLGVREDIVPVLSVRNKGHKPKSRAVARLSRQLKSNQLFKTIYPRLPAGFRSAVVDVRNKNYEQIPQIPEEIVQRLGITYRDEILRLESLLDRDLSAWKRG